MQVNRRALRLLMEDEQLAQAAQSLDNTGSWYFVGAQDCRSAQVRLQEQIYGTVGHREVFRPYCYRRD